MWRNAARAMHLRTPAGAGLQTPNFNVVVLCCAVLQAKEAEVSAYEPISDDDMQDDNMVLAHAVLCCSCRPRALRQVPTSPCLMMTWKMQKWGRREWRRGSEANVAKVRL